jgi:hypothetical protein
MLWANLEAVEIIHTRWRPVDPTHVSWLLRWDICWSNAYSLPNLGVEES